VVEVLPEILGIFSITVLVQSNVSIFVTPVPSGAVIGNSTTRLLFWMYVMNPPRLLEGQLLLHENSQLPLLKYTLADEPQVLLPPYTPTLFSSVGVKYIRYEGIF
jgi:hypothetical protein